MLGFLPEAKECSHETTNYPCDETFSELQVIAMRPRRKGEPEVFTHTIKEEVYVFDSKSGLFVRLNSTASTIWNLCDGTNTIEHIVKVLTTEFEIDNTVEAKEDVLSLVHEMQGHGWLTL